MLCAITVCKVMCGHGVEVSGSIGLLFIQHLLDWLIVSHVKVNYI